MRRKIQNHLVSHREWKEWNDYEDYLYFDEIIKSDYNAYKDTPSKDDCDKICAKLSGKVKTYYIVKNR